MGKEDQIDLMDLDQLKGVVKELYKFVEKWVNPDELTMDLYSNEVRGQKKSKLKDDFDKIIK